MNGVQNYYTGGLREMRSICRRGLDGGDKVGEPKPPSDWVAEAYCSRLQKPLGQYLN